MVEGDPDIDAIHRLIFKETRSFIRSEPIILAETIFVHLIRKILYGRTRVYYSICRQP